MSSNSDTEAARRYHEGTKHPGGFLLDPGYIYHPDLKPLPFKIYENGELISLPLDTAPVGMSALDAIAASPQPGGRSKPPDLATLSRILYFSAGITKKIAYQWGEMHFRAAACTGALYHIEPYVACRDLPGLEAGVYHYEPHNHTLVRLRAGDFRAAISAIAGAESHLARAPLAILYTDVWQRNAVKYQARAYRHTFWDGGTILSHTLAMCAAHELASHLVVGFVDGAMNDLLGLDNSEEAAFALVAVGQDEEPPPSPPKVWSLYLSAETVAGQKQVLRPIVEMHSASELSDGAAVVAWRERPPSTAKPVSEKAEELLPLPSESELASAPLEDVILRRGSTRRFARQPLSFEELSVVLRQSTQGLGADFLEPYGAGLNTPYVIAHAVEGLPAGSYMYHRDRAALEPIREGGFRADAGRLALGQDLAADAAANVYFLTDLDAVLQRFGNRGYRAAQLEAAISAGRMYLAAYAQGFGATGLTFFDDAVTDFFSPHAEGKAVMFLIALGVKAKRR